MLYCKFEYNIDSKPGTKEAREIESVRAEMMGRSKRLNDRLKGRARLFISSKTDETATIFGSAEGIKTREFAGLADKFMADLGCEAKRGAESEITISQFLSLLRSASRSGYIGDDDEIKYEMGLEDFHSYRGIDPEEMLIENIYTKSQALTRYKQMMYGVSLKEELERIFTKESVGNFPAHPVHYAIISDDANVRKEIREILLGSLYKVGRLQNRRVCFVKPDEDRPRAMVDVNLAESIYKAQAGGTVVLQPVYNISDDDYLGRGMDDMRKLIFHVRNYRRKVLTVIEFERRESSFCESYLSELADITFIRLEEDIMFSKEAGTYLCNKAKADKIKDCNALLDRLPKREQGFLVADLNKIYDVWLDEYLCNNVYSQYAGLTLIREKEDDPPKGDAYAELAALVGLADVKTMIRSIIDYHNAGKLLAERAKKQGLTVPKNARPAMHMVFSGNPGTAKTTVARLVAEIMKDNKLLAVGSLVEVGRADMVDRFVGGTAPRVRRIFQKAKGSVLFIDEAYSLVDDRRGSFGDEAVSTIVQEMENAREDTVVIFAGYSDKMEGFLQLNPGLRSRIAFHVPFPDYSKEELLEILQIFVDGEDFILTDAALAKVDQIIQEAMGHNDFGNGRFARKLFEQAKINYSSRIMALPHNENLEKSIGILVEEDFSLPKQYGLGPKERVIGF